MTRLEAPAGLFVQICGHPLEKLSCLAGSAREEPYDDTVLPPGRAGSKRLEVLEPMLVLRLLE